MSIASLTLGISSLWAWLDPIIGFPISVVGIITGILSLRRSQHHRKKVVVGLALSLITLLLAVILIMAGVIAYMGFPERFTY